MPPQPVLSRHRLPKGYRYTLAALWITRQRKDSFDNIRVGISRLAT